VRQRLTPPRLAWRFFCGLAGIVFALDATAALAATPGLPLQGIWPALTIILIAILVGIVGYAAWRARRASRRTASVRKTLAPIDSRRPLAQQSAAVNAINEEFDAWRLSLAERDVAWFLLKGLPMKEIARLRGASETTVRKQARAIYSKAGLEGRSDLAAHILDRCLVPSASSPHEGVEPAR